MNPLKRIINGVTDASIYGRIGWMYASFFTLFVPLTVLSYFLLPEGILRGKHPIISNLDFSPSLWISTLQIFGYDLIPTFLIMGANLIAQQSRFSTDRFVPVGYLAFWGLTVTFALYLGTWSFEYVTTPPPLYLNTFNVNEYIQALEAGRLPIALSLNLTPDMQMAGWLYWRIYETRFQKPDFQKKFGTEFEKVYGKYTKPLAFMGFLKDRQDEIILSDRGAYWLDCLQDLFSIDHISKLWGTSKQNPWPDRVVL